MADTTYVCQVSNDEIQFRNQTDGTLPCWIDETGVHPESLTASKLTVSLPLRKVLTNFHIENSSGGVITGISTDVKMTANSDVLTCTQKAVNTRIDNCRPTGIAPVEIYTMYDNGIKMSNTVHLINNDPAPEAITGITAIDIDGTLAANSDLRLATQKAVKTYCGSVAGNLTASLPLIRVGDDFRIQNSAAAAITSVNIDGTLAGNSDTQLATQKAVKTYVDNTIGVAINPAPFLSVTPAWNGAGPFNNVSIGDVTALGPLRNKIFLAMQMPVGNVPNAGAHITGFDATNISNSAYTIVSMYLSRAEQSATGPQIVIDHLSGSSTDVNRIMCPGGGALTLNLNPYSILTLMYEPVIHRWVVLDYTA